MCINENSSHFAFGPIFEYHIYENQLSFINGKKVISSIFEYHSGRRKLIKSIVLYSTSIIMVDKNQSNQLFCMVQVSYTGRRKSMKKIVLYGTSIILKEILFIKFR
jgi:hypothetical protein